MRRDAIDAIHIVAAPLVLTAMTEQGMPLLGQLSDWLLEVHTPFGSESFRYLRRTVDPAGIGDALHQ